MGYIFQLCKLGDAESSLHSGHKSGPSKEPGSFQFCKILVYSFKLINLHDEAAQPSGRGQASGHKVIANWR